MQLFGSFVLGVFGAVVCLPVELALLTQLPLVQGELFCLAWQFEDQRIANRRGGRLGVAEIHQRGIQIVGGNRQASQLPGGPALIPRHAGIFGQCVRGKRASFRAGVVA